MFHGRISLNLVPLLLLPNFVSGSRLEFMYMSLRSTNINIRSSLIHLHGFQLLVPLPWLNEITLVCTNRNSLLLLKRRPYRLVIVAKGFLKQPNVLILTKPKNLSLLRNYLALATFGELLIVFSTKLNLLHYPYWMALACCLLHVIMPN